MTTKPRVFFIGLSLLLFFSGTYLGSQEIDGESIYDTHSRSLGFRVGLFWLGQSAPTDVQGVAPSQIVQSLGVSYRLPLSQLIALEPGFDFFYREYLYSPDLDRAVITPMETGSFTGPLAGVLGLVINLPVSFHVPILSDRFALAFKPGLSGVFRVPLWGIDGTTSDETGIIFTDLNRAGRFLFPETAMGFVLGMGEKTDVEFGFRVLYPIWHTWDVRGLPFWDTLIVWGNFTIRWNL